MKPIHPQIEKGRSTLAKESATATNQTHNKEMIDMNKTTFTAVAGLEAFTTEEILAEILRRSTSVTPPAGFKLEYFCTCGCGCTPDDRMEEDCEIEGHSFEGPSTHLTNSTGCQVNTSWNPEDGISFRISNYGYNKLDEYVERAWTREEVEQLPEMVKKVLSRIDLAEAKAFLEANPEPFKKEPTVTDLAEMADENNLKAPELFRAYMELTNGGAK